MDSHLGPYPKSSGLSKQSETMEERSKAKLDELTPSMRQVDVLVKVLSLGDRKTIGSRYGNSRDLVEAVVGDETATVTMTLWDDQIDRVAEDDVLSVDNGYVSLVRGHMRLNVGKYGSFKSSDQDIADVKTEVDMSEREYETDRYTSRRGGSTSGSYGGGGPRRRKERRPRGRRKY